MTEKDSVLFIDSSEPPKSDLNQQQGQASEASETTSAFNEETGEINWDCPCLGPMTQPPCGEKFKAAFSCFVYSKEEPKGSECVELFRTMQSCFNEHPEIYGIEEDK